MHGQNTYTDAHIHIYIRKSRYMHIFALAAGERHGQFMIYIYIHRYRYLNTTIQNHSMMNDQYHGTTHYTLPKLSVHMI